MTDHAGGTALIRSHRRPLAAVAAVGVLSVGLFAGVAGAQSNEVNISGSSTVEPITSLVAELYAEKNPDANIRVDGPGTGDGFVLFCKGETDVSDASRQIKDEGEEAPACRTNGIEYTELPIGIDGLTVVANKASKIKCLSFNDLYAIFGPESGGGQVDLADASALATELGGSKAPTSGTVKKFTPGAESGTYDSFIEIAYQKILDAQLEAGKIPSDKVGTDDAGEPTVTEPLIAAGTFPNDNDIVKRVEGSKNGLGFFGYAYYQANKGDLKEVAIEDAETGKCVKPTAKTIKDGTYPISRTLYVYPNNAKVAENATLKEFLAYYLTKKSLTKNVTEAGYVPLAPADIQSTIEAWKGLAG
jgi:phosphate transport system substrate-binding protein